MPRSTISTKRQLQDCMTGTPEERGGVDAYLGTTTSRRGTESTSRKGRMFSLDCAFRDLTSP